MEGLQGLNLRPSYHKGINDIAGEFYLPCMRDSILYDRAVGFFNSTIYAIAWSALKDFVSQNGKMRIICSPVLTDNDVAAIDGGYLARVEDDIAKRLKLDVENLLAEEKLSKPTKVLAALISLGIIEIKIAFVSTSNKVARKRLFHDKVGIFTDNFGNKVAFKGSMNETWSGLSNEGNLESVDVFLTWGGEREMSRVESETTYFNSLWNNHYPTVIVKPFPDVAKSAFISAAKVSNWEMLLDDLVSEIQKNETKVQFETPVKKARTPRPHQKTALDNWKNAGRRGIFEHATGSGKTFTAICAIRDSLSFGEVVLVLVPSDLLLRQWSSELREELQDLNPRILVCGGGNTEWRKDRLLSSWTRNPNGKDARIVLSTLQTAASGEFRSFLSQGNQIFIVVDEVHRIGSLEFSKILELDTGPRLGLSATPRRAGDMEGTKKIFDYFQGIISPPFTLKDALEAETLTKYFYYIHTVKLTYSEQKQWDVISKKISRLCAQNGKNKSDDNVPQSHIKLLLIQRARIVKAAVNKIKISLDIINRHYEPGQKWILYCDSQNQVRDICTLLKANDYPAMEYHSAMEGDRVNTLRIFDTNGGIVVSIKCLDEGVDIPSVSHALILASSKNPREFIQRRGRVLRKSEGKYVSYIHDVLVLPNKIEEETTGLSILESELARAIEFGKWAENPSSITDLERIAVEFSLDYRLLTQGGIEDDDD